jgi:hypothetical protein
VASRPLYLSGTAATAAAVFGTDNEKKPASLAGYGWLCVEGRLAMQCNAVCQGWECRNRSSGCECVMYGGVVLGVGWWAETSTLTSRWGKYDEAGQQTGKQLSSKEASNAKEREALMAVGPPGVMLHCNNRCAVREQEHPSCLYPNTASSHPIPSVPSSRCTHTRHLSLNHALASPGLSYSLHARELTAKPTSALGHPQEGAGAGAT